MTQSQSEYASRLRKAAVIIEDLQSKLQAAEAVNHEPIAIVGIGCRFPGGADTPERYWQLLRDGTDLITEVPEDRPPLNTVYTKIPRPDGELCDFRGGFVQDVSLFDAQFFGISPREAKVLDPHHRLLLEVSWEALENAAIVPERLAKSRTGVFVGICGNDYTRKLLNQPPEEKLLPERRQERGDAIDQHKRRAQRAQRPP